MFKGIKEVLVTPLGEVLSFLGGIELYRPYAIDVITHITKCETDGGRKSGTMPPF